MRLLFSYFFYCLIWAASPLWAQNATSISYTQKNGQYSQLFDGLPASGSYSLIGKGVHYLQNAPIAANNLPGWQFYQIGGSGTNAAFGVSTGSATGQSVYSVGSSSNTDRALGTLASGTGIYSIGLILTNNTGTTLNSISVSFVAEQWRKGGSTNRNTWTCKYKTGVIDHINQSNLNELPLLNFYSVMNSSGAATLNGNLPENQLSISKTLDIVDWKPGEQLLLRWDDADETGSDDIVGIDQFNFSADYKPPSPVAINTITSLSNNVTNADTIKYAIKLDGNIVGLSAQHFAIRTNGLVNTAIAKIEGSGGDYTATIFTGKGTGLIQLGIVNDSNTVPGIINLPFFSVDSQWIDKDLPTLTNFYSLSDTLLKAGDTLKLGLTFSETVAIQQNSPTNFLPITIGTTTRNFVYAAGNNSNTLIFQYKIQAGELDKDGLQIANSFVEKNLLIADPIGNIASLPFINTAMQRIKIDAIAPAFMQANDTTIETCISNTAISIDQYLSVNNKEPGEILTWKLNTAPTKLSIVTTQFQRSSTASSFQPNVFSLTNTQSYVGKDSCVFSISDGINQVLKKIYFNTVAIASNNTIQSNQEICTNSSTQPIVGNEKLSADSAAAYLWEISNISDSTGYVLAQGKNQLKDYPAIVLTKNTWFRRKLIKGVCTNLSNPVQIKIFTSGLWNGLANSNWNNTSNWCGNKLPSDSSEILIPIGALNMPTITELASAKKIIVQNKAALTITGTLVLNDQIIADSGTVNAVNGTIILNGKNKQLFNAAVLSQQLIGNLSIDNVNGVSLNSSLTILQQLNLTKGILETNDLLNLKYRARVGASAMGTGISGNVKVEHIWDKQLGNITLAGHPFNHSLFNSQLNKGIGFTHHSINSLDSFSIANDWKIIEPDTTNPINHWKKHQGIQLQIEEMNINESAIFTGKLNTGLQEIPLIKNKSNGFNVIANPFVAPINLSAIAKSRMTGNYFWIWNAKQGIKGGYTAIPANQTYILNPFEAFIAEARSDQENSLYIPEESKVSNYNLSGIEPYKEENGFFVELSMYSDQQFWDRLILVENAGAKNALDSLDGIKLLNPEGNLYSLSSDQKKLAVDVRKLDNNALIPVIIETTLNKKFTLKVNQAFLPGDNSLVLHDRFTNMYCALAKDSIYTVEFSEDPQSRAKDRFQISRFVPKGNTQQLFNSLTIKLYPNPASQELTVGIKSNTEGNSTIQIYSLSGLLVKSVSVGKIQSGSVKIPISDLSSGTYLLQVINGGSQKSIQFIKQ